MHVRGPMDCTKMLKLRLCVGDLDLRDQEKKGIPVVWSGGGG